MCLVNLAIDSVLLTTQDASKAVVLCLGKKETAGRMGRGFEPALVQDRWDFVSFSHRGALTGQFDQPFGRWEEPHLWREACNLHRL